MIINRKSKLWVLYNLLFPGADLKNNIWITFYPNIYCPGYITEDLKIHEQIHLDQQKNRIGALIWWFKYYFSKDFRKNQELPAYLAQYKYLKKHIDVHNIHKVSNLNRRLASILSGPVYKNMMSYQEALNYINQNE